MKTTMLAGLILAASTLAAQPGVKSPENAVSNDALTQAVDLRTEDAYIVSWNTDEVGYGHMLVLRLSFARNAPEFAFQKIYWGTHAYDLSDVSLQEAESLNEDRRFITLRAGEERILPNQSPPSFPGTALLVYTVKKETKQYVIPTVTRQIESREARKSR